METHTAYCVSISLYINTDSGAIVSSRCSHTHTHTHVINIHYSKLCHKHLFLLFHRLQTSTFSSRKSPVRSFFQFHTSRQSNVKLSINYFSGCPRLPMNESITLKHLGRWSTETRLDWNHIRTSSLWVTAHQGALNVRQIFKIKHLRTRLTKSNFLPLSPPSPWNWVIGRVSATYSYWCGTKPKTDSEVLKECVKCNTLTPMWWSYLSFLYFLCLTTSYWEVWRTAVVSRDITGIPQELLHCTWEPHRLTVSPELTFKSQ